MQCPFTKKEAHKRFRDMLIAWLFKLQKNNGLQDVHSEPGAMRHGADLILQRTAISVHTN